MERELFSRLWEEIDFDDHPLHGGHGSEPEGEFTFSQSDDSISVGDARLTCLLYTSPSPRDQRGSRMPSSA